jgi:hypothetical protein
MIKMVIKREQKIVEYMVQLYCQGHHHAEKELCVECQELLVYAHQRILKCPFGNQKPTCAQCPVHCYQPDKREQIREVMRYAGPYMLYKHPFLTLFHLFNRVRSGVRQYPQERGKEL